MGQVDSRYRLQNLLTIDSDFDVTITGFEIPEIDILLTTDHGKPDPDDDFETTKIGEAVRGPMICGNWADIGCFAGVRSNNRRFHN